MSSYKFSKVIFIVVQQIYLSIIKCVQIFTNARYYMLLKEVFVCPCKYAIYDFRIS